MNTWSVADSLKLYNIENWGGRYFNINPSGAMMVYPSQASGEGINLHRLVQEIAARGLGMPVVIRFQDILRHRVVELNEAFREAIREAGYRGRYQGVYPIKVNQMSEVVEEILDAGRPYDHGLEAGSKAELAAVLAMDTTPQSLIIVNGYKDYDIIKMALMGLKLGKRVLIVIEKLSELLHVIEVSKELGVFPLIGIRAKLYSKGSGKWESSGGEFAKFGLTTPEIIRAVRILVQEGMQESFKLLHFHIGSQITNIRTVKSAVKEATRIYSKLVKMGLNIEFLDVGGGLGVDYDGSRTNFNSSTNYSLREYVADVVYSIQEICAAEEVKEPHIVSESGRALVAHHSVLVVNVFGHIEVANSNEADLVILRGGETEEADVVKEIRYLFQNISGKNLLEHFHDAVQRKEEAISMFNLGILSLEDRAKVETIFWYIAKAIYKKSRELKYIPEEVEDLHKQLADQYLCNFSVFQSMLDHWAIQHLFPIAPIHRMDEKPMRHATLADITCDSDGKVTKFIDLRDIKDTLPLHDLR
ncbi:MAG: biosynthetic arginine decarboxylase, partial [Bdellovibrionales bacterium]|nr:biosynthetic arginine decarboxylase [Bdellovibrionales bacterium]